MLIPTPNESYVIHLAFTGVFREEAQVLARRLQMAYMTGSVAGFFEWTRLGSVTLVSFERNIGSDMEVLECKGLSMTERTVRLQLALEFRESLEHSSFLDKNDSEISEAWLLIDKVADALERCASETSVKGLPQDQPKIRVTADIAVGGGVDVTAEAVKRSLVQFAQGSGAVLINVDVVSLP